MSQWPGRIHQGEGKNYVQYASLLSSLNPDYYVTLGHPPTPKIIQINLILVWAGGEGVGITKTLFKKKYHLNVSSPYRRVSVSIDH